MMGPGFAQKIGERVGGFLLIIVLGILLVATAVGFALGRAC
jgi:hypothetical protein